MEMICCKKRGVYVLFTVLLLILLLICAAFGIYVLRDKSEETVLFRDDFIAGEVQEWTSVGYEWKFDGKNGHLESPYVNRPDGIGAIITADSTSGGDYKVNVTFRVEGWNGSIGVLGRYIDNRNYYELVYNGKNKLLSLHKMENGIRKTISAKSELEIPDKEEHTLKLQFHKTSIKAYVDDTVCLKSKDGSFRNGLIGLSAFKQYAKFDSVTVIGKNKEAKSTLTDDEQINKQVNTIKNPKDNTLHSIQRAYYVSVNGDDTNDGTIEKPFKSINRAREEIRRENKDMSGDVVVYIRGGEYLLDKPLVFDEKDSGTNNFNVVYKAYKDEKVSISGGRNITGWTKVDGKNIWKAKVDNDTFRQFYINGERRQRARTPVELAAAGWYDDPKTPYKRDGYYIANNKQHVAFSGKTKMQVHVQVWWRDFYLPVEEVFDIGDRKILKMKQPYFDKALNVKPELAAPTLNNTFYLENSLDLLDVEGEWYFDEDVRELYYYPKKGEDMRSVKAIVPDLECIIDIRGSSTANKVKNLWFEGMVFEYGSWRQPSKAAFLCLQSQIIFGEGNKADMIPAAIKLNSAANIIFKRNVIRNMGAVGLGLYNAVENCSIEGNVFKDISDGAITIGMEEHDYISDGEEVCRNNYIGSNLIRRIGEDYWSAAAIQAFYVDGLSISHNDIADIPYSAICVGWGWASKTKSTTCKNNEITNNRIYDFLKRTMDGGGIYTLGQQPGSIIRGNYIKNPSNLKGELIYHDEGTAFYKTENNVLEGKIYPWFYANGSKTYDIRARNNFTDSDIIKNSGTNVLIMGTYLAEDGKWPHKAVEIINSSGLQEEYRDLYK